MTRWCGVVFPNIHEFNIESCSNLSSSTILKLTERAQQVKLVSLKNFQLKKEAFPLLQKCTHAALCDSDIYSLSQVKGCFDKANLNSLKVLILQNSHFRDFQSLLEILVNIPKNLLFLGFGGCKYSFEVIREIRNGVDISANPAWTSTLSLLPENVLIEACSRFLQIESGEILRPLQNLDQDLENESDKVKKRRQELVIDGTFLSAAEKDFIEFIIVNSQEFVSVEWIDTTQDRLELLDDTFISCEIQKNIEESKGGSSDSPTKVHGNSQNMFLQALLTSTNARSNARQCSALHVACMQNDFDRVKWLLGKGINYLKKDAKGFTAFHRACDLGHAECVKAHIDFLISETQTTCRTCTDADATTIVPFNNKFVPFEVTTRICNLIFARNHTLETPLYNAALKGHVAVVAALCSTFPSRWRCENSAIESCSLVDVDLYLVQQQKAFGAFRCSPREGDSGRAKTGLGPGVMIEADKFYTSSLDCLSQDDKNFSPLHASILNKSAECTELLLRAGCSANHPDSYLQTPLHLAHRYTRADLVQMLADYGASYELKNERGLRPGEAPREKQQYARRRK